MATNRKLIDYLPHYVQEYLEMQKIMEAEQPEFDLAWDAVEGVFNDQFIMDATERGVSRWESMLGISPKGTDTLDERKFRILTQLNQELPYTMRKLEQALSNLCGEDGYSILMNAAEYYIEVRLAVSNRNNFGEVEKILAKMLPANLTSSIQIMRNSHEVLARFTHGYLSGYTHETLRNEVFE